MSVDEDKEPQEELPPPDAGEGQEPPEGPKRPLRDNLASYAGMIIMVFGGLLAITLYIPSVANDAPFDEAAGYRTSAVVFGQKRLIHAMIPLTAVIVPLGVWIVLQPSINWQYRLFDGIAALAAVVATVMALMLFHPPHIELNPLILLTPIGVLLAFYFVLGIVWLAT